ncbi:MAG TPA: GGDEF domain-containing protein [Bacillota bacterium]
MGEPAAARFYQAAIGTVGGLLMLYLTPSIPPGSVLSLLFLTLLYVLFSQRLVTLPSGLKITAAFPIVVAAIAAHGPAVAMWSTLPAVLLWTFTQKFHPLRTFFNVGHFALSIGAAAAVFRAVAGGYGQLILPFGFIPLFLATVTYDLINLGLIGARMAFVEHQRWVPVLYRTLLERRSATLLYHVLAVVMAILYLDRGPYGALIVSVCLVGLNQFFRIMNEMDEVRLQAITDRLTHVYNYRYFADWLENRFPALTDKGEPVTILFVDINDLKAFNDTYGHHAGDLALQTVARVLQGYTRNTDKIVRYGGDEFVVMLPRTDAELAERIAERIRDVVVESRVTVDGAELPVAVSIGMCTYPTDTPAPGDLVRVADQAMYLAKSRGSNCICNAGELLVKS